MNTKPSVPSAPTPRWLLMVLAFLPSVIFVLVINGLPGNGFSYQQDREVFSWYSVVSGLCYLATAILIGKDAYYLRRSGAPGVLRGLTALVCIVVLLSWTGDAVTHIVKRAVSASHGCRLYSQSQDMYGYETVERCANFPDQTDSRQMFAY